MARATAILFKAKVHFCSWCAIYRVPSLDSLGRSPAAGPQLLTPRWPGLGGRAFMSMLAWPKLASNHRPESLSRCQSQSRLFSSYPLSQPCTTCTFSSQLVFIYIKCHLSILRKIPLVCWKQSHWDDLLKARSFGRCKETHIGSPCSCMGTRTKERQEGLAGEVRITV